MAKDKKKGGFDSVPDKSGKGSKTTTVKKKRALADPTSGDQFNLADNLGCLVLIDPQSVEKIITSASPDEVEVIRGDVTVLTEDDGKTALDEPTVYQNTLIFGRVVVSSIKPLAGSGDLVIGEIAQGAKTPGKNPAWILQAASNKQRKIAEAFLD